MVKGAGRFLLKAGLFIALQLILLAAGLLLGARFNPFYQNRRQGNAEVTLLPTIGRGESNQLLLLGASNARAFARSGNAARVERITGTRVFNLARDGGGIVVAKSYLELYFDRNNRADTIVFLMSPWMFYSRAWNEEFRLLEEEQFDPVFFRVLLGNGVSLPRLHFWLKDNLLWTHAGRNPPLESSSQDAELEEFSPDRAAKLVEFLYPDGRRRETLKYYTAKLEAMIAVGRENGSGFVVVVPPTLIPEVSRDEAFFEEISALSRRLGFPFIDASRELQEKRYYYDHEHFNTAGVEEFTRKILEPLAEGRNRSS